jgi:hypothetical protein
VRNRIERRGGEEEVQGSVGQFYALCSVSSGKTANEAAALTIFSRRSLGSED